MARFDGYFGPFHRQGATRLLDRQDLECTFDAVRRLRRCGTAPTLDNIARRLDAQLPHYVVAAALDALVDEGRLISTPIVVEWTRDWRKTEAHYHPTSDA